MPRKIILLSIVISLAACKKQINDEDKISYPYTLKATQIVSSQKVVMYADNGVVRDEEVIASFLKRHGGLSQFVPQPRYQIEFLSKDSARIDLGQEIFRITPSDTNGLVFRSDVQLLKNTYSSTALQRELLVYKLNRFNSNLRAIPQANNIIKEIYKCELGYFGWFRNNQFIFPVITYKLNLYNRKAYFNGSLYGIWNLAFPAELQSRDTLVVQEHRVAFTKY